MVQDHSERPDIVRVILEGIQFVLNELGDFSVVIHVKGALEKGLSDRICIELLLVGEHLHVHILVCEGDGEGKAHPLVVKSVGVETHFLQTVVQQEVELNVLLVVLNLGGENWVFKEQVEQHQTLVTHSGPFGVLVEYLE